MSKTDTSIFQDVCEFDNKRFVFEGASVWAVYRNSGDGYIHEMKITSPRKSTASMLSSAYDDATLYE